MIKAISYWSMKDGLANTKPIADALSEARAAGFAGMEIAIGTEGVLHTRSTQADCQRVREQIDASGLTVETSAAAFTWGINPTSEDPAVRKRSLELHIAAVERTAWLGCQAMLYVPGVVTSPITPDQIIRYDHAVERARESIKRLLDTAESAGVDLCIENVWNGMFYSPLELADFVDSFGSTRLGVYFDVGNVLGYHQYPPHWIELLGRRIKRVHIKEFRHEFGFDGHYSFPRLGEGDVPWAASMAALRAIGYDRTVVAEMLPPADGLLEHTSQAMDQILTMKEQ